MVVVVVVVVVVVFSTYGFLPQTLRNLSFRREFPLSFFLVVACCSFLVFLVVPFFLVLKSSMLEGLQALPQVALAPVRVLCKAHFKVRLQ